MKDRVRELRGRLAPVLEVVSASARRDIEELFELASQPTNENFRLLREVREALDLVERATGVTAEPPPRKRTRQSVHALLVAVLRERRAPLSARDLTAQLVGRGASVTIEDVRRGLERDEFAKVGRHRYELAQEPRPEAEPAAKPPRARTALNVRAELAPAPAATGEDVEPTGPMLIDRLRALFESEPAPLTPGEIARRLLASGWSTRSSRPQNVISAALSKSSEFERTNGKYRLARGEPASGPDPHRPRGRGLRPTVPLGEHVYSIVTLRGAAMTYAEILEQLVRERWTSVSPRKRDVLANAVRLHPELELVLPGVVWIRGAKPASNDGPIPASAVEPEKMVGHREPADLAELARELAFVRQHVDDAHADTAVLAPAYAARQFSAWAARARSIAERAGEGDIATDCGTLVRELASLAQSWSLGRAHPALAPSATPRAVLAGETKGENGAEPSWESVADGFEAQLERAFDEAAFDDGWSDTGWLADDERFATEQLDRTEALLSRLRAPFGGPPALTASFALEPKDLRELVEAARGLRWVRGVVIDGARWGACMGRLRWLAQKNPSAKDSKLVEVLAPEYQPAAGGWGFDGDATGQKRRWLSSELETMNGTGLEAWLSQAVDCLDDAEIAGLLEHRASELSRVDLRQFESRRVRARVAKVMDSMGLLPRGNGVRLPDIGEEPPRVPRFPSARALLAARLRGRRTVMLSNRADDALEQTLALAFDLDLEWCVATPRRAALAAETIRNAQPDLVLSATGFHTARMDATFAEAATAVGALFVRVNRPRVACCARALVRSLAADARDRDSAVASSALAPAHRSPLA